MKSEAVGTSTLEAEVTQIDRQGIWVLIGDKESFVPFENYPKFRDASVSAIHNVQLLNANHLYWPELDIDVAVDSIDRPGSFPLVAK